MKMGTSTQVQQPDAGQLQREMKMLVSGPAVPSWRWRTISFSLPSPVDPSRTLGFVLLDPFYSRVLSGFRVIAMLMLLWLLLRQVKAALLSSTKLLAPIACTILLFVAQPAAAEIPSRELLSDIEKQLQETLCQREHCSTLEKVTFTLKKESFAISLLVSSEGPAAVLLPGPLSALTPTTVRVNGKEEISFRRTDQDFLQIRTPEGRSSIEVVGPMPSADAFALQIPQQPLFIGVEGDDWIVEGLSDGVAREGLRFIRVARDTTISTKKVNEVSLPAWVKARRDITIGDQVTIKTAVTRLGSLEKPLQIRVPLLKGEQILSSGASVENGALLVTFRGGEETTTFSGLLGRTPELTLATSPTPFVSEEWKVSCDGTLSCSFSGPPPTSTVVTGRQAFVWNPYPNESVVASIEELPGIPGDFITIDSTLHQVYWGAGQMKGKVNLSLRATQQSSLTVSVPAASTITEGSLNGKNEGRVAQSSVSFLLPPGEHKVAASYIHPWSPSVVETTPPISLTVPAHNVTIQLHPTEDRWVLWSWGLPWGPCVIYWSKLLTLVLLCVLLSYMKFLPMNMGNAALLGIGLTSLPMILISIPLLWLMSLSLAPLIVAKFSLSSRAARITALLLLTVLALGTFYRIVEIGLVHRPPTLIAGNNSTFARLNWYTDHVTDTLPQTKILSLPLWTWRTFSLLWATWLVVAMLRWLGVLVEILRGPFGKEPEDSPLTSTE